MCDVWCLLCFAPVLLASALQTRGVVGVGCEAPHLRCILRIIRMDLVPPDLSLNLFIRSFGVG